MTCERPQWMILTVGLSTDSVLNLPLAGLSPETGGRVFVFEGLAQTYPLPDITDSTLFLLCSAFFGLCSFFRRAWDFCSRTILVLLLLLVLFVIE